MWKASLIETGIAGERARATRTVGRLGGLGLTPGQSGGGADERMKDRIDLGDARLGQVRNLHGREGAVAVGGKESLDGPPERPLIHGRTHLRRR